MARDMRDKTWLKELAKSLQIPIQVANPPLPIPANYISSYRVEDEESANQLLVRASEARRAEPSKTKAFLSRNAKSKDKYSYEDYCKVLTEVVNRRGSLRVAEALWDSFQDEQPKKAKTKIFARRKRPITEETTRLLRTLLANAIEDGNAEMVSFLAHVADRPTLDAVLPRTIRNRSIECLQILLEHDADPENCSEDFLALIQNGELQLVRLLLRSRKRMSQATITAALPIAVSAGDIEILHILLDYGADADAQHGRAIERAVRAKRMDLAVILLLAQNPPSSETLVRVAEYAYYELSTTEDLKYSLIELLLHGGAAGDQVSRILVETVKQKWVKLVRLLVAKGASVQYKRAEAFRYAVSELDMDTVNVLNRSKLGRDLATTVFADIPKLKHGSRKSREASRELMCLLLRQGAHGNVVDDALIYWVHAQDIEAVRKLLQHGASVDYKSASALQAAVSSEQLDMVDCLLARSPRTASLTSIFSHIRTISRQARLYVTKQLLDAGARGPAVDATLWSSVVQSSADRDLEYIDILVAGGADVNQKEGELFRVVVQASDKGALAVLLRGSASPSLLSASVPFAMKLAPEIRQSILTLLLNRGARGPEVSQALVNSVDGTIAGSHLIKLLLSTGEADVNFGQGGSIKAAILCNDSDALSLLLQYGHLNQKVFGSCLILAINLPPDDSTRLEKLHLLFSSGIRISRDTGVSALCHEMRNLKRTRSVTLDILRQLLNAGAKIDHDGGRVLLNAIDLDLIECFKFFLEFNPSSRSLEAAFEKVLQGSVHTCDLRYIKLLLKVGMQQETIDEALVRAVERGRDEELVQLLLSFDASVNFRSGQPVCSAISRQDFNLVELLLRHRPTAKTLEAAFSLSMELTDGHLKFLAFRYILGAGMRGDTKLSEALISAADGGDRSWDTCKLLLDHNASASYKNGEALSHAIKSSNYSIKLIELLLSRGASDVAVEAALYCSFVSLKAGSRLAAINLLLRTSKPAMVLDRMLLQAVQDSSCDHSLIEVLLKEGASVHHNESQCVLHAVEAGDLKKLQILKPFIDGHAVASKAFQLAWRRTNRAVSPKYEAVLTLLLQTGATGQDVDNALLKYIKDYHLSPTAHRFINSLLDAGANVDFGAGACLEAAAAQGNICVLRDLLARNPTQKSMSSALPWVFRSDADSSKLKELVETFCIHNPSPDLNYCHPQLGSVLWQMLNTHPNEQGLLRYIINAGCDVDYVVETSLFNTSDVEKVSLLCWAISCEKKFLHDAVIDILIQAGANVNYMTSTSHHTPLRLAILRSRSSCVSTLLKFRADPSTVSRHGESLLSLACSMGTSDIVQQLIEAGADINDSLHEASRMVDLDTMQVLLKACHRSDYPSARFHGRTALAELCLKAGNQPFSRMKKAIMLLKNSGNFTMKSGGKSVLHFALDNKKAVDITRSLLEGFMWEHINDDFNIFEDGRYRFSPLAYVAKGYNQAPASQRPALETLLKEFGCKLRFWAAEGNQPEDATDAPPEIDAFIQERKRRDIVLQDQLAAAQRRLSQRREEEAEELVHIRARHSLTMQNQRKKADQAAQIDEETAVRQAKIAEHKYNAEVAHTSRLAGERLQLRNEENRLMIENQKNLALVEQAQLDTRYNADSRRRGEEIEYLRKQEEIQTAGTERRARIQKDVISEQMRLTDAQKEYMRMNERMQRTLRSTEQQGLDYDLE